MDLQSYLRAERLAVDDPYDQQGLLPKERVPRSNLKVVFDNFYYVPTEKVFCHICGGHRHNKGITGLLDDGSRMLFGSACAKDYFGNEVAKLCAADLRRRTRAARSRYRVLEFRNSAEDIQDWIRSYGPLVRSCQEIWSTIKLRHKDSFDEITEHLRKNNGRLIDSFSETVINPLTGKTEHFENHKILIVIRSSGAIENITKLTQQLSLVEVFVQSAKSVHTIEDQMIINRLNEMFKNVQRAAEAIDDVLEFSSDFFSPQKLIQIGKWLDERRLTRLRDQEDITPRDSAKLFRKIAGTGAGGPKSRLLEVVKGSQSASLLDSYTVTSQKRAIKEGSQ